METRVQKRGHRRLATVTTTAGGGAPDKSARPGRLYFVGRRAELESLYGAMRDAVVGEKLVPVAVVGEAGIGKTRLVAELIAIVTESKRQVRVLSADLADPGGRPLMTQLLRARFALEEGTNPAEDVDRVALALGGLVTPKRLDDATRLLASLMGLGIDANGTPRPGFEPAVTGHPDFRERAIRTALNLLRYDASSRPVVLVIDGWSTAGHLEDRQMVGRLLTTLADRPVCAIVLSRGVVAGLPPLEKAAPLREVALGPLGDPEMTRLVSGLLENVAELPGQVVATTVQQARGVPLLGEELVRLLIHRGTVRADVPEDAGAPVRWAFRGDDVEPRAMPADLAGSARESLAGLGGNEREIVTAAAVLGTTFWAGGVVSLIRARPDGAGDVLLGSDPVRLTIEGALMSLVERGFFKKGEGSVLAKHDALQFENAALRDHSLAALAPAELARLQRLAAQWVAAQAPADRLPWLELCAGHYEAGGLGREAARLWLEAGELERGRGNPRRAIDVYRRGLSLVGDDAAALAADLLHRLGQTAFETGDTAEAERCLAAEARMAAILDDPLRTARSHDLLGQVHQTCGRYDRSQEHLTCALRLYEAVGFAAGLADVRENLGKLHAQRGDKDAYKKALEELEQALKLRRQVKDEPATAQTLTSLANVKYGMGLLEDAVKLHTEALRIREEQNDRRGRLMTLNGLGAARFDNGQNDQAIELWEQALRIADEIGDRTYHAMLSANLAEVRLASGALDAAEQSIKDGLETAQELGNARILGLIEALYSSIELAHGNETSALERAERALEHGYAIENRAVICQALLAQAKALSHALFIADAEVSERRHKQASESYQKAITLLEEMGDKPLLIRALDAYGTFLVERGAKNKGRKLIVQAESLRQGMRSPEQREKAFHEARTIRRQMPTGPIAQADLLKELQLLQTTKGQPKK